MKIEITQEEAKVLLMAVRTLANHHRFAIEENIQDILYELEGLLLTKTIKNGFKNE